MITDQECKLSSLNVESVFGRKVGGCLVFSPWGGVWELYQRISWSLALLCPNFTEYLFVFYSLLLSLIALSIELQIPIDWLNQFRLVHLQMAQREKHKNKQNRKKKIKKKTSSCTFRAFGSFVIQRVTLSSVTVSFFQDSIEVVVVFPLHNL